GCEGTGTPREEVQVIRQTMIAALALLGACAPKSRGADSTSALTVDTVKPLVTAGQSTGAGAGASTSASATGTGASTAPTTTTKGTSTKERTDTSRHLGRDSAFRRDPRDPRHQLKTVPKPPE